MILATAAVLMAAAIALGIKATGGDAAGPTSIA